MGLLDIFCSPKKQIQLDNKELTKPNSTVAKVIAYNEYDREESYEDDNGQTQWRTIREAAVTLRYILDGQWREEHRGPSEGYSGFVLGEQVIVNCGRSGGIGGFGRTLRRDSPNRI